MSKIPSQSLFNYEYQYPKESIEVDGSEEDPRDRLFEQRGFVNH